MIAIIRYQQLHLKLMKILMMNHSLKVYNIKIRNYYKLKLIKIKITIK